MGQKKGLRPCQMLVGPAIVNIFVVYGVAYIFCDFVNELLPSCKEGEFFQV